MLLELITNAINKYRNSLEILNVLGYNEQNCSPSPYYSFPKSSLYDSQ